jgi:hypothetical protein
MFENKNPKAVFIILSNNFLENILSGFFQIGWHILKSASIVENKAIIRNVDGSKNKKNFSFARLLLKMLFT